MNQKPDLVTSLKGGNTLAHPHNCFLYGFVAFAGSSPHSRSEDLQDTASQAETVSGISIRQGTHFLRKHGKTMFDPRNSLSIQELLEQSRFTITIKFFARTSKTEQHLLKFSSSIYFKYAQKPTHEQENANGFTNARKEASWHSLHGQLLVPC